MKFQRIQDLRVDSDLSQRQLGEILHISQRSYSHYETGSRGIPIEMLIRLADYYDTTIDYLVGRTDNKAPVKYSFLFHQQKKRKPSRLDCFLFFIIKSKFLSFLHLLFDLPTAGSY